MDARSLKAQGIERETERHLGAGQVQRFDTEQLHAILERRDAERQAQQSFYERDSVIDVTTSLRETPSEWDNLTHGQEQNIVPEQDEIDLQSLVNEAMAEFQGIHQEMERQRERECQQEKERQRLAEQTRQKPDKGWSFSR